MTQRKTSKCVSNTDPKTLRDETRAKSPSQILASEEFLTYRLTGRSAILMNSPRGMIESGKKIQGKSVVTKRIPEPHEEAENGCYRMPDQQLYFPAEGFRKAIVEAGRGKKFGNTRRGANNVVRGCLFLVDEYVFLFDANGDSIKDYRIDTRRAVPPGQGAVSRSRPAIDDWMGVLRLVAYPMSVGVDSLAPMVDELIAIAGTVIGIGNYRPEKGGSFGRFLAERIEE